MLRGREDCHSAEVHGNGSQLIFYPNLVFSVRASSAIASANPSADSCVCVCVYMNVVYYANMSVHVFTMKFSYLEALLLCSSTAVHRQKIYIPASAPAPMENNGDER